MATLEIPPLQIKKNGVDLGMSKIKNIASAKKIGNQVLRFTGRKKATLGALCASAGTTLSMYYDEIVAHRNISYMIHNPSMGVQVNRPSDFASKEKLYMSLLNGAVRIYNERTGISEGELKKMMDEETWFDAEELLKRKFIDEIIDKVDNKLPADTSMVFERHGIVVPETLNLATGQPKFEPQKAKNKDENNNKTKSESMKEFMARLIVAFQLKGVTSESSEGEVLNALSSAFKDNQEGAATNAADLTKLKNEVTAKDAEIATLKGQVQGHKTAKVKAMLDIAENTEQKITNPERLEFEKMAMESESGYSTVVNLLALRQPHEPLVNKVTTSTATNGGAKTIEEATYMRLAQMKIEQ